MKMTDGRSSVTCAAPAAGVSSQGTPESAGHGSRDTIVVSTGPAAIRQRSDAGDRGYCQMKMMVGINSANLEMEKSLLPHSPSGPTTR